MLQHSKLKLPLTNQFLTLGIKKMEESSSGQHVILYNFRGSIASKLRFLTAYWKWDYKGDAKCHFAC